MATFRELLGLLEKRGEVVRIRRTVSPRFELGALLQQAEARDKAVLFESVAGSDWPVAAGLLTGPVRFALGLGVSGPEQLDRDAHASLVAAAIAAPVAVEKIKAGACQSVVRTGSELNCDVLPVPTFFAEDSGRYITAAVGLCRNPENGVINAGYYRVLVTGRDEVVVSVGKSSDLLGFLQADAAAGRITRMALVIGSDPAVQMAAASKTPSDRSELEVAGALAGSALKVVSALHSDLLLPADAECILEISIDHRRQVPNTMGEFGDLYGTQEGHVAKVEAITHRPDPLFHVIRAGAGREHNSIGFIILYDVQRELQRYLADMHPEVLGVRAHFDPPAMGPTGDIFVQVQAEGVSDPHRFAREILGLHCGGYDLARVIRRIVLVDEDINIDDARQVNWAIANRALTAERYSCIDDLPLAGLTVRLAVDATMSAGQREQLKRLQIPEADQILLDDYL